jgi:hypothetical protein
VRQSCRYCDRIRFENVAQQGVEFGNAAGLYNFPSSDSAARAPSCCLMKNDLVARLRILSVEVGRWFERETRTLLHYNVTFALQWYANIRRFRILCAPHSGGSGMLSGSHQPRLNATSTSASLTEACRLNGIRIILYTTSGSVNADKNR